MEERITGVKGFIIILYVNGNYGIFVMTYKWKSVSQNENVFN